jgi:hypothetical protein
MNDTPANRLRSLQFWLLENVFMVADWDTDDVEWLEDHLYLIGELHASGCVSV